jgi:hypothetical protein
MMKLSTPSITVFLVSTVMVLVVILVRYFNVQVPILGIVARDHPFELTLVAWAVLFAGVTFKV